MHIRYGQKISMLLFCLLVSCAGKDMCKVEKNNTQNNTDKYSIVNKTTNSKLYKTECENNNSSSKTNLAPIESVKSRVYTVTSPGRSHYVNKKMGVVGSSYNNTQFKTDLSLF